MQLQHSGQEPAVERRRRPRVSCQGRDQGFPDGGQEVIKYFPIDTRSFTLRCRKRVGNQQKPTSVPDREVKGCRLTFLYGVKRTSRAGGGPKGTSPSRSTSPSVEDSLSMQPCLLRKGPGPTAGKMVAAGSFLPDYHRYRVGS